MVDTYSSDRPLHRIDDSFPERLAHSHGGRRTPIVVTAVIIVGVVGIGTGYRFLEIFFFQIFLLHLRPPFTHSFSRLL